MAFMHAPQCTASGLAIQLDDTHVRHVAHWSAHDTAVDALSKPSYFVNDEEWEALTVLANHTESLVVAPSLPSRHFDPHAQSGIAGLGPGDQDGSMSSGGWSDVGGDTSLPPSTSQLPPSPSQARPHCQLASDRSSQGQVAGGEAASQEAQASGMVGAPRRAARAMRGATARALKALTALVAQTSRLQARGVHSTATLALRNNALLQRLDGRMADSSASLQEAQHMADWAKQVVQLSRELEVYKAQCGQLHEDLIRAAHIMQEKDGELRLLHHELQQEREQGARTQQSSKDLLERSQVELVKLTEALCQQQAEGRALRQQLQALEAEAPPADLAPPSQPGTHSFSLPRSPCASPPPHTCLPQQALGSQGWSEQLSKQLEQAAADPSPGAWPHDPHPSTPMSWLDGAAPQAVVLPPALPEGGRRMEEKANRKFYSVLKKVVDKNQAVVREKDARIDGLEAQCERLQQQLDQHLQQQQQHASPTLPGRSAAGVEDALQAHVPPQAGEGEAATAGSHAGSRAAGPVCGPRAPLHLATKGFAAGQQDASWERSKAGAVPPQQQQGAAPGQGPEQTACDMGGQHELAWQQRAEALQRELEQQTELYEAVLHELQQARQRSSESESRAGQAVRELAALRELAAASGASLGAAGAEREAAAAAAAAAELEEAQAHLARLQAEVERLQCALQASQATAQLSHQQVGVLQAQLQALQQQATHCGTAASASPALQPSGRHQPCSAAADTMPGDSSRVEADVGREVQGSSSALLLAQSQVEALEQQLSEKQALLATFLAAAQQAAQQQLGALAQLPSQGWGGEEVREGHASNAHCRPGHRASQLGSCQRGGEQAAAAQAAQSRAQHGRALLALLSRLQAVEAQHCQPLGGQAQASQARVQLIQTQLEALVRAVLGDARLQQAGGHTGQHRHRSVDRTTLKAAPQDEFPQLRSPASPPQQALGVQDEGHTQGVGRGSEAAWLGAGMAGLLLPTAACVSCPGQPAGQQASGHALPSSPGSFTGPAAPAAMPSMLMSTGSSPGMMPGKVAGQGQQCGSGIGRLKPSPSRTAMQEPLELPSQGQGQGPASRLEPDRQGPRTTPLTQPHSLKGSEWEEGGWPWSHLPKHSAARPAAGGPKPKGLGVGNGPWGWDQEDDLLQGLGDSAWSLPQLEPPPDFS